MRAATAMRSLMIVPQPHACVCVCVCVMVVQPRGALSMDFNLNRSNRVRVLGSRAGPNDGVKTGELARASGRASSI